MNTINQTNLGKGDVGISSLLNKRLRNKKSQASLENTWQPSHLVYSLNTNQLCDINPFFSALIVMYVSSTSQESLVDLKCCRIRLFNSGSY